MSSSQTDHAGFTALGCARDPSAGRQPGTLTLVAHSFGCLASLYAARQLPEKVSSLFLVAPADPDLLGVQEALINHPAAVAGRIIASSNDPWMPLDRVCFWSQRWRLPLSLLGPLRHINAESARYMAGRAGITALALPTII